MWKFILHVAYTLNWFRVFKIGLKVNPDTLITDSVEIIVHLCVSKLKHLRMHSSQLLVNTCYLQVF